MSRPSIITHAYVDFDGKCGMCNYGPGEEWHFFPPEKPLDDRPWFVVTHRSFMQPVLAGPFGSEGEAVYWARGFGQRHADATTWVALQVESPDAV